jgi:ribosome recycling factor
MEEKQKKEKLNWNELIEGKKADFEETIERLKEDLKKIRISRASPGLIEDLKCEVYGQKFPLKQLGQISIVPPRQIVIQPWDQSYIPSIVKAIENSDTGLTPIVEKEGIKIDIPPLTEEFKKDILRLLSQKKDKAKKAIRETREKIWNKIQEAFQEKRISEDEKYKAKDKIQELVEDYNEKIEEIIEKKEKEIKE